MLHKMFMYPMNHATLYRNLEKNNLTAKRKYS